MKLFHTIKAVATAVPVLAALSSPATAALLTYDFEGVIDVADASTVFFGKGVGDTFTGSFTLDTDASVMTSLPVAKIYSGAFALSIDGAPLDSVELAVFDDTPGGDDLALYDPFTGISLDFHDSTGTALSGLGVPTTPLILGDWDYIRIVYTFFGAFDVIEDIGSLTSLTLQQSGTGVPAPGALALLSLGLFGLGVRCRAA